MLPATLQILRDLVSLCRPDVNFVFFLDTFVHVTLADTPSGPGSLLMA